MHEWMFQLWVISLIDRLERITVIKSILSKRSPLPRPRERSATRSEFDTGGSGGAFHSQRSPSEDVPDAQASCVCVTLFSIFLLALGGLSATAAADSTKEDDTSDKIACVERSLDWPHIFFDRDDLSGDDADKWIAFISALQKQEALRIENFHRHLDNLPGKSSWRIEYWYNQDAGQSEGKLVKAQDESIFFEPIPLIGKAGFAEGVEFLGFEPDSTDVTRLIYFSGSIAGADHGHEYYSYILYNELSGTFGPIQGYASIHGQLRRSPCDNILGIHMEALHVHVDLGGEWVATP